MRSITLLTILALLYCPLSCVVGQGFGVSLQQEAGADTARVVGCCCCSKSSSTAPVQSNDSGTNHKDCQGICNGAVHERHDVSIDLPELALLAICPAFQDVSTASAKTSQLQDSLHPDQQILSGRQLRTLYLALIC